MRLMLCRCAGLAGRTISSCAAAVPRPQRPVLLPLAGMYGVERCGAGDVNGCGGWGKGQGDREDRCEWCGGGRGVEGFRTLNPCPSLPFPGVLEPEAIPEGAELCSQGKPAEHVWLLRVSVGGNGRV